MLKKGSGILVAEEKGVAPQSINYHLLSISLIIIKYKIIHYAEVPRININ
jgi:hypothetical protein